MALTASLLDTKLMLGGNQGEERQWKQIILTSIRSKSNIICWTQNQQTICYYILKMSIDTYFSWFASMFGEIQIYDWNILLLHCYIKPKCACLSDQIPWEIILQGHLWCCMRWYKRRDWLEGNCATAGVAPCRCTTTSWTVHCSALHPLHHQNLWQDFILYYTAFQSLWCVCLRAVQRNGIAAKQEYECNNRPSLHSEYISSRKFLLICNLSSFQF